MRLFVLAALAITTFVATITINRTDANAVVCARGVHRAGCVGVVHPRCSWVVVNGVRVHRCI
jgi:hypothetical protein